MKKILNISLLTIASLHVHGQTWQWATSMGGSDGDGIATACIDSLNNLYVTGRFTDNCIIGDDTLLSESTRTVFIAKVNNTGMIDWAKKAEGYEVTNGNTPGASVYYDSFDSSILISSRMSGPNQAIGDCILYPNGQMGIEKHYLTKLDTDGECIWTLDLLNVQVMQLVSDGLGDFYSIIRTSNSGSVFGGNFLTAGRYLVKQKSVDGSVIWAKKILDFDVVLPEIDYFSGHLWVSGNTGSDTDFTFDTVTMTTYPNDIFVSKFDTTGTLQWVKTLGGEDVEYTSHIGVDSDGNAYLSGFITSEMYFDDTTLTTLNGDIILIKLDSQGNRIWVTQSNASNEVLYYGGVSDDEGNSLVVGKFTGTVLFDGYTLTASSVQDGFVVKYNSSGACIGAKTINNIGWSSISAAIDNDGNTLVTGGYEGTANFDGITLTALGGSDVFVAKIDLKTSVPELRVDGSNELFIYANPNEGKCTIDVPDDFLYENNLVLRIFDTSGKLIRQSPLVMNQGKIQLSLEQEAKGVYTATLSNSQKSYQGRIVFE